MAPLVNIVSLNKRFGRLQVLNDVSLQMTSGASIALIGPNGCGKTTLIKTILNMVLPDSGSIFFDGLDIKGAVSYRQFIGYMPQIGRYPDNMSVGQVLDTMRSLRAESAAVDDDLYHAFGMNHLLDKRMRTLSGGTRQKVSAVIAFMFRPRMLILDEPTAGLDPLSSALLQEKIAAERRMGRLVLITSHLLSELDEMVSEVILMHDGAVAFHRSSEHLKEEAGEERLSKAITAVLRRSQA
ncbi:MAG: ABC transporter ATP-binding protein [Chitinophagaceae bacterium]|jgi:Cu-processing system ATP-binding protein|nr:ABC transporter ATP-binding protein [Chitinophagaceae bacterium]